jgi:release factor glutamine methyltransferase
VVRRSAEYLARHGVPSPRETAEALVMHVLGTDRAGMYARTEGLDTPTAKRLGRALCRRCAGTPLQHLTGEQRFLDLDLEVRPGVFVPRPETEGLVVAALEVLEGIASPAVIDVGTGTGAIALAIKAHRPDARVIAIDRSEAAASLAQANADRLGLDVDVVLGDLLDAAPVAWRGRVDLVVSNPPYVEPEAFDALPADVRADPAEALVGGTDVHARLAADASGWLRAGGWLAMEIGQDQGEAVRSMFGPAWSRAEVLPDLAGRDRVVRARFDGA